MRHEAMPVPIKLTAFVDTDAPSVNGAIDVQVSASNLGRPIGGTFPLELRTTFESSLVPLQEFIATQAPTRSSQPR